MKKGRKITLSEAREIALKIQRDAEERLKKDNGNNNVPSRVFICKDLN